MDSYGVPSCHKKTEEPLAMTSLHLSRSVKKSLGPVGPRLFVYWVKGKVFGFEALIHLRRVFGVREGIGLRGLGEVVKDQYGLGDGIHAGVIVEIHLKGGMG